VRSDRGAPPPEVLAAIAAAYRLLAAGAAPPPRPTPSRWRSAARLEIDDVSDLRLLARSRSRWKAADRRDG
jgi:hypothetical protein